MSRRTPSPAAAGAARAPADPIPPAASPGPDTTMPKAARLAAPVSAASVPAVLETAEPVRAPEIPTLELAGEVRRLLLAGRAGEARELYGDVVGRHQRRAWRLACYYLR